MARKISKIIRHREALKLIAVLSIALESALLIFMSAQPAQALSVSSTRDCNSNAVIFCGALSTQELIAKYNASPSVQAIFSNYFITPQVIQNMNATAVLGTVMKTGQVIVGGKIVATSAITAGRDFIPGSIKIVSDGIIFYQRTPAISFLNNSLVAFVVMNSNKQFSFAILASCGNPVIAIPVPMPKPHSTPPAVVHVKPAPASQTQMQSQSQTQIVTINNNVTTPPTAASSTTQAPSSLPNTGTSDGGILGLFVGISSIGAIVHHLIQRRQLMK